MNKHDIWRAKLTRVYSAGKEVEASPIWHATVNTAEGLERRESCSKPNWLDESIHAAAELSMLLEGLQACDEGEFSAELYEFRRAAAFIWITLEEMRIAKEGS